MNGYPAGTKCVVTFVQEHAYQCWTLGEVVTVLEGVHPRGRDHLTTVQETEKRNNGSDRKEWPHLWYPIAWLRPIDGDITNDDLDVVEMYKGRDVVFQTVKIPVSGRIKILGLP